MNDPKKQRYLYLTLVGFGAISLSIVLFFALYRLRGIGEVLESIIGILTPFIYGGVVAYLLRPLCNAIESFLYSHLSPKFRGISHILAVLGSIFTLILIIYALGAMIFPRVYDSIVILGKTIPSRVENFIIWAESTFGQDERMDEFFNYFNTSYDKLYQETEAWVRNTLVPQISTLVSGVGSSVYALLKVVYNLLMGLIVATYLLFSRKKFARQSEMIVRSVFSPRWADIVLNEVTLIDRMFGGFIDAKILDSAIIGVLCYVGCGILRMPNTLLISVFVGVTNVIPFFGPLIGAVPSTLLILIEDPIKALWFILFVVLLQQLDGNVIGPRIMGNRIGISGFWVMFSIILFGGMWGIVGMVVGVPLFAVIYDLVRKFVKYGLEKKNMVEVWEQYVADYPNEDLKQLDPNKPKVSEWHMEDWRRAGRQGMQSVKRRLTEYKNVILKVWAFLVRIALAVWAFLCRIWHACTKLLSSWKKEK